VPGSLDAPFTEQELVFLRELARSDARFVLVGLAAAVVQGADTVTQDLDIWVESSSSPAIAAAARAAGGFYSARTSPPMIGGEGLDRIDLVTHCDGLASFADEYEHTSALAIDDFEIRVLDLDRIIASKEAAGRDKDLAVLPQLRAALAALRSGG
jgi:hypothetical protein